MRAVFKHELSSYFTGLTGYIFAAFLLFFAGIYTMVYNIDAAVTNFEYAIGSMSFVYLVAVPILTMRILAEERRQKTDQLLYSLPLTMTKVVLGKYTAMLVVLLAPILIIGCYPIILSAFGNIYLPAAFSTLFSFFLLGGCLLAIGMFISSVTESQAVAAGLCFVVMLINYFIGSLADYVSETAFASYFAFIILALLLAIIFRIMTKNGFVSLLLAAFLVAGISCLYIFDSSIFQGLFPLVMEKLSLFERYEIFVNGIFDVTGIVYFISVITVFLFLSVQSLERRRWSE